MKKCIHCGSENLDDLTNCCDCGATEFTLLESQSLPSEAEAESALTPEPWPVVLPETESALCTYCLFPNPPDEPSCKRCGSPLNFSSIVGPLEVALASGFMWRGAVRGRPKNFVLAGVWFLFFPRLILNLLIVY